MAICLAYVRVEIGRAGARGINNDYLVPYGSTSDP